MSNNNSRVKQFIYQIFPYSFSVIHRVNRVDAQRIVDFLEMAWHKCRFNWFVLRLRMENRWYFQRILLAFLVGFYRYKVTTLNSLIPSRPTALFNRSRYGSPSASVIEFMSVYFQFFIKRATPLIRIS